MKFDIFLIIHLKDTTEAYFMNDKWFENQFTYVSATCIYIYSIFIVGGLYLFVFIVFKFKDLLIALTRNMAQQLYKEQLENSYQQRKYRRMSPCFHPHS